MDDEKEKEAVIKLEKKHAESRRDGRQSRLETGSRRLLIYGIARWVSLSRRCTSATFDSILSVTFKSPNLAMLISPFLVVRRFFRICPV